MKEKTNFSIGGRIRVLRKRQRHSLRGLAERSGLSFNAISRIERGENSPTVATLHRLAGALGVPITAFFTVEAEKQVVHVKRDHAVRSTAGAVTMESMASGLHDQQIEPFRMTIEPGTGNMDSPISHDGEEFVYCLSGAFEYHVGEETYRLDPGDSILFKASLPHGWWNPGKTPATVLMVFDARNEGEKSIHSHLSGEESPEQTPVNEEHDS